MISLTWTTSHAVWIEEIDDDHKEIFEALAEFQETLAAEALSRLTDSITAHFAHEERLMRAARYPGLVWHKRKHEAATKKVARLEGHALVEYVASWLNDHTAVADRMMASYLRNRNRLGKLTFRAGTKPADAVAWVDSAGNRFDPLATTSKL